MSIRILFLDVDGTLTDGKIYLGDNGEVVKAFNIKDGYAIRHMLPEHGIIPVIITGRSSKIVENRAKELQIKELYQGVIEKKKTLKSIMKKYECGRDDCAYFGDDIADISGMEECGVVGCPGDAVDEVKTISQYICHRDAGYGAAREFIEWLIRNN